MKLSTPKNITFYISVALAVIALVTFFIKSDITAWLTPLLMLVAFVLLAAGNLFEGL